jgi:hypothetical protein
MYIDRLVPTLDLVQDTSHITMKVRVGTIEPPSMSLRPITARGWDLGSREKINEITKVQV